MSLILPTSPALNDTLVYSGRKWVYNGTKWVGAPVSFSLTSSDVGLNNVSNNAQLKIASNLSDLNNAGTARSNIGLGNVDNTSDVNKPVSTAQQTALNLKANLASPTFTGTVGGITAGMVGLGSVTNDAQLKVASNLSDLSNKTTSRVNLLPSMTGKSLQNLRVNSGETDIEYASISGGVAVQDITATGTWTKPTCTFVMVELWGAGQAGFRGSAGNDDFSGFGGGGGWGGCYSRAVFKASGLPASGTVTIGAGGTGGNGAAGGHTNFLGLLYAFANTVNWGSLSFYIGGATETPPISTAATQDTFMAGRRGGTGGQGTDWSGLGGTEGTKGGGLRTNATINAGTGTGANGGAVATNGSDGDSTGSLSPVGTAGGGGGGGTITPTAAGKGGNGGIASGGGGGGGSDIHGSLAPGDGGNGGNGWARITTW